MQRIAAVLFRTALVLLFAIALWVRISSLESLPDVNGDEVWHAIQLTNLMRGEPYRLWTVTDLPLSPIHAALELPFLLVFKPSLWVVRLPALLTGILAVVLTYVLGSKILDRTTALIATALMAVLPVAIIFSRVSYESSHAPLFGILCIYLAYRLKIKTLVFLFPFCYFIHPTNIFLLPELLVLVMVQTFKDSSVQPSRRWRLWIARSVALTSVVLAMGLYTMQRPSTQRLSKTFDTGLHGRHDFSEFWSSFERMLLGTSSDPAPVRSWLFWVALIVLIDFGLRRLARDRRWDRVAFVAGPILCAVALFVMGGSNVIQPSMTRYGLFLVTPTVLGVACLLRAILVEPRNALLAATRRCQVAAMLFVGGALLFSLDLRCLNQWSFAAQKDRNTLETPWTFRTDIPPPAKRIAEIVRQDLAKGAARRNALTDVTRPGGPEPTAILAEDWCKYGPLEWLMISRRDVDVFDFHDIGDVHQPKVDRMLARLRRGGFALCLPGSALDVDVRVFFSPQMLRQWEIFHKDQRFATLVRLNHVISVPGDYDGDGRTDSAVYRVDTGEWIIPSRGPGAIKLGDPGRDIPVPGDYDGDGRTDVAVFRVDTGEWIIPVLGAAPMRLGEPGKDVPVPGDYDGDGRTDIAVFRGLTGEWFVPCLGSTPQSFAFAGFIAPVPGDYNGDGRTDMAVFRIDTAEWYVPCLGPTPRQKGDPGRDIPVPGDYDGDGRCDIAVYRPSFGQWFIERSSGGAMNVQLGKALVDQPSPGDYDGDGRTDIAVYRASTAESIIQVENPELRITRFGPSGREDPGVRGWGSSPEQLTPIAAGKPSPETKVR